MLSRSFCDKGVKLRVAIKYPELTELLVPGTGTPQYWPSGIYLLQTALQLRFTCCKFLSSYVSVPLYFLGRCPDPSHEFILISYFTGILGSSS